MKEKISEIAKSVDTVNEFIDKLFYLTRPYKQVTKDNIGELVRIDTHTYGRKNHKQFNMGCPKEGKIIKLNKVSFVIGSPKGELKIPMEALISDDISFFEGVTPCNVEEFYEKLKAE